MTILAGIAALVAGTVLAFGVRGANTERLMAPEEFADETWGITLFTVNWANGALAAALGAAIGGVATGGTASAVLAGIALGSYTWAGRLLLRQAVAERELAARELGIAETATTEEKTAHTVDRRMRRHELWQPERDARQGVAREREADVDDHAEREHGRRMHDDHMAARERGSRAKGSSGWSRSRAPRASAARGTASGSCAPRSRSSRCTAGWSRKSRNDSTAPARQTRRERGRAGGRRHANLPAQRDGTPSTSADGKPLAAALENREDGPVVGRRGVVPERVEAVRHQRTGAERGRGHAENVRAVREVRVVEPALGAGGEHRPVALDGTGGRAHGELHRPVPAGKGPERNGELRPLAGNAGSDETRDPAGRRRLTAKHPGHGRAARGVRPDPQAGSLDRLTQSRHHKGEEETGRGRGGSGTRTGECRQQRYLPEDATGDRKRSHRGAGTNRSDDTGRRVSETRF